MSGRPESGLPRWPQVECRIEVSLAVLAAISATSTAYFPVTFLSGIGTCAFTPVGLGVVLCIFASFFFATTVMPLLSAKVTHVTFSHLLSAGLSTLFREDFCRSLAIFWVNLLAAESDRSLS
jgi:multidrug efflux pump subunit AcrB